ncbi:hypothetical protein [Streptomyces sp. CA-132043]|uniref:hypothetical protein n=1 Tax=Streptomyces sp. CA-132043 TaxID=3240048 RepID=UPI003D90A7FB
MGPARVGAVSAALTLLPLVALAVLGTYRTTRVVAQRTTAAAHTRDDEAVPAPAQH